MSAVSQILGPAMPDQIVLEEFWIFELDHGGAGAGGRDDEPISGERLDGVLSQDASVIMVAAVEMRLAATRLRLWKIDLDSEPAKQPNRRFTDVGEKHVPQAGDHQGNFQEEFQA
jgi:hypothetical protein